MSVFFTTTCEMYYCSLIWDIERPQNVFNCTGLFNYPDGFLFPYEFENCYFKISKELSCNFDGGWMEFSYTCKMVILTMLILWIHGYGISLHFLFFPPISFFRSMMFISYWSLTCLDRVTARFLRYLWLWWRGTILWGHCFSHYFLSLFIFCIKEDYWSTGGFFFF